MLPSVSRRVMPTHPLRPARAARALWLRWTLMLTLGELLGFGFVAAVLPVLWLLGVPEPVMWAASIPAGAVEGAAVGIAQWLVLRRVLPGINGRAWIALTALAASLAYAMAWVLNAAGETSGGAFSPTLIAAVGAAAIVFLLSMGGAQWLVLRHHLARAAWWIVANALAWPLGVAIPILTISLVPDSAPLAWSIVAGITGGVLMGLTVGALTGAALVWLLRHYDATIPHASLG